MTYLITSEHIHLYLSENNADMVYRVRAIVFQLCFSPHVDFVDVALLWFSALFLDTGTVSPRGTAQRSVCLSILKCSIELKITQSHLSRLYIQNTHTHTHIVSLLKLVF